MTGSFFILANSLVDGFVNSNGIGRGIVIAQICGSVFMFAAIIGKWRELGFIVRKTRLFLHDFTTGSDVLDYYFNRRPSAVFGIEWIYKVTCERLLKLLAPDVRSLLAGHQTDGNGSAALTAREIELVKSTCDHALDEEGVRVAHGMTIVATAVSLAPMLGLLGTVWGVLDAFYEMGSSGSANLATIAPSISSALVTTVVGLLIAIPGVAAYNYMDSVIRNVQIDMDGFADELTGRIACEFQGKGA